MLIPSDAEDCVIGQQKIDITGFFLCLSIPANHRVHKKYLATYLRARARALKRPQAATEHFGNATLAEKLSVVDNDLVASSGRRRSARLRFGNRPRHDIRGRLVRLPLVLGFRRPVCNDLLPPAAASMHRRSSSRVVLEIVTGACPSRFLCSAAISRQSAAETEFGGAAASASSRTSI